MKTIYEFYQFLSLVMLSQRGEVGFEGGDEDLSDDNLDEDSDDLDWDDEDFDDYDSDDDDDDFEADEDSKSRDYDDDEEDEDLDSDKKLSAKEQLESLKDSKGKEGDGNDLLSKINELGITRNGLPAEFDDLEKVKEYISKGFDYTQKTMEHSEKVKSELEEIESTKSLLSEEIEKVNEYERGVEDKLIENQIFGQILSELANSDPEIHAQIASVFNQRKGLIDMQAKNPHVTKINEELKSVKQQLEESRKAQESKEDEATVRNYQEGLNTVKTEYGPLMRQLGVTPNWKKVVEKFVNDESQTMTVEQAFFAEHGTLINKAYMAQQKLNKTKFSSSKRRGPSRAGKGRSKRTDISRDPYMDDLMKFASEF